MRIVFMGTPDFAVPSLEKLIKNHDILGVFTQPDKPKGRGQKLQFTPVKEVALRYNIPVFQPRKLKDDAESIEFLLNKKPDAIIVVAYGQILPKSILDIPVYGCINAHASLLPKYRGAAPINWAIIRGEKETGVTTMLMSQGLDTGDMLLSESVEIHPEETAEELYNILMNLSADLLIKTLRGLSEGSLKPKKQDDALASYAPMMTKDLGKIDFNKRNTDIHNLIRGVTPWPGAYFYYNDKIIKVWKSELVNGNSEEPSGKIVDISKNGIRVTCGEGTIVFKEIQEVGGKRMDISSYLNGHNINKGEFLK